MLELRQDRGFRIGGEGYKDFVMKLARLHRKLPAFPHLRTFTWLKAYMLLIGLLMSISIL